MNIILLILTGILAGTLSGIFGIGGGIIIVPMLIYALGYGSQLAVGTSVGVLLPPIGILAAINYYKHGNLDIKAALIIAAAMIISGYFGSEIANRISNENLRLYFGIFLVVLGVYTIYKNIK